MMGTGGERKRKIRRDEDHLAGFGQVAAKGDVEKQATDSNPEDNTMILKVKMTKKDTNVLMNNKPGGSILTSHGLTQ